MELESYPPAATADQSGHCTANIQSQTTASATADGSSITTSDTQGGSNTASISTEEPSTHPTAAEPTSAISSSTPNVDQQDAPASRPSRAWLILERHFAISNLLIAIVVLVFAVISYRYARWTAMKDFRDDCRETLALNHTISEECRIALKIPLPLPPLAEQSLGCGSCSEPGECLYEQMYDFGDPRILEFVDHHLSAMWMSFWKALLLSGSVLPDKNVLIASYVVLPCYLAVLIGPVLHCLFKLSYSPAHVAAQAGKAYAFYLAVGLTGLWNWTCETMFKVIILNPPTSNKVLSTAGARLATFFCDLPLIPLGCLLILYPAYQWNTGWLIAVNVAVCTLLATRIGFDIAILDQYPTMPSIVAAFFAFLSVFVTLIALSRRRAKRQTIAFYLLGFMLVMLLLNGRIRALARDHVRTLEVLRSRMCDRNIGLNCARLDMHGVGTSDGVKSLVA
jgi:hypothetical protein